MQQGDANALPFAHQKPMPTAEGRTADRDHDQLCIGTNNTEKMYRSNNDTIAAAFTTWGESTITNVSGKKGEMVIGVYSGRHEKLHSAKCQLGAY